MKNLKLSIITINYNNLVGLERTVCSVVSQTWRDFEYIIIDGGSTDGSAEYITEMREHFTYWVSEPDKGIYSAMNKGIAHAKGDYLYFLNSGDVLYLNQLGLCMQSVHTPNKIYNFKYFLSYDSVLFPIEDISYDLISLLDIMVNHQSIIYGKQCFKHNFFDESYFICSDFDHLLKLLISGTEIESINCFLSIYDTSGISSSSVSLCQISKERERILMSNINSNVLSILVECKMLRGKYLNMRNSRLLRFLIFFGFLRSLR